MRKQKNIQQHKYVSKHRWCFFPCVMMYTKLFSKRRVPAQFSVCSFGLLKWLISSLHSVSQITIFCLFVRCCITPAILPGIYIKMYIVTKQMTMTIQHNTTATPTSCVEALFYCSSLHDCISSIPVTDLFWCCVYRLSIRNNVCMCFENNCPDIVSVTPPILIVICSLTSASPLVCRNVHRFVFSFSWMSCV